MSETGSETGIESSNVDPTVVESEAREQGWLPKDEFKGDPDKWVSADEFVERGRHVMPLLRKNNERLMGQISQITSKVSQLEAQLEAARGDLEAFEEFHNEELTRRVEETRASILAKLKVAKENQDTETEVQLTDDLIRLNSAEKSAESGEKVEKTANGHDKAPDNTQTPEYLAWKAANEWFEVDQERTFEAMEAANRMLFEMRTGKLKEVKGAAFFRELDKRLSSGRSVNGRVEGSRGGSTGERRTGRTYSDLPAEAKAVCDKYAEKFVRKGGKFETVEAYRKHYVAGLEQQGYFNN